MSQLQVYNGKDTIATLRLWHILRERFDQHTLTTYKRSMALQAPLMYAMLRGILVDSEQANKLREQFKAECKQLERALDRITRPNQMGSINIGSGAQLKWLFHCLGVDKLPAPKNYKTKSKDSVDDDALEKIMAAHHDLTPICKIILMWRDRAKMLQVLNPDLLSLDGRMRTFYKVFGTTTGRLSSSQDIHSHRAMKIKSGMNMQNIKRDEDELKFKHASIRSMFIPDRGKKFINIDLGRADSFAVALEVFKFTGDRKYLDACTKTDLHTYVSTLVWPHLGWTGDPRQDRAIAEQFYWRQFDYRFMSKKLQHGGNYLGSPRTLAIQMKMPVEPVAKAFDAYFKEFPFIPKWHRIRARHLQTTGTLINLLGRKRVFRARLDSDSTLRKAIAFLGQSCTAEVINSAMLNLWRVQIQMPDLGLEFLAQVHDSVLLQYPEENEAEVVDTVLQVMQVPITVVSPQGEQVTVCLPLEASAGWNWAKVQKDPRTKQIVANPGGLLDIKPGQIDDRSRLSQPIEAKSGLMDRRVSRIHRRHQQSISVPQMGGDLHCGSSA